MEPKPQTTVQQPTTDTGKAKKKSGGAVQIFRVALLMLRRRSKKSKAPPVDMASDKGVWRRLLGSMRPLHIQGNEAAAGATMSSLPSKPNEDFEELPLPSPSRSFSPASRSSSFTTSQYASATNLQELDDSSSSDDDEDAAAGDENGGDEMIDAKAEEFIAQFYEQMRRQRYNIY